MDLRKGRSRMNKIDLITTEMAEHICDELCRYPVFFKDESLENNCAECKLGQYICDILNECKEE